MMSIFIIVNVRRLIFKQKLEDKVRKKKKGGKRDVEHVLLIIAKLAWFRLENAHVSEADPRITIKK